MVRNGFVAGWDGTASVSDSPRLQDPAAIEAQVPGSPAPCIGDLSLPFQAPGFILWSGEAWFK